MIKVSYFVPVNSPTNYGHVLRLVCELWAPVERKLLRQKGRYRMTF